ncbi:hypothetical protein Tco_0665840 [Tanacetum coccineum]
MPRGTTQVVTRGASNDWCQMCRYEVRGTVAVRGVSTRQYERGDDKEVITNNELSNPGDDNLIGENKIAQIFRIDTHVFCFETPLCQTFKEFNYFSQINVDVLTKDIPGFKTFEEYKDDWIYNWNDKIPWINEKPWTNNEVCTESFGNIHHECNPLRFKNGTALLPTCNWKEDAYCNTRDLPGFIQEGNSIRFEYYEWYDTIENSELKEEALINKMILEESMNVMEKSSNVEWNRDSPVDEWKDYEHTTYIKTDVSSNQNTYNNVCQIVMDHCKTQEEQGWFDEHELMGDNDDDIGYLEDYLIQKDPPYYVNEDEERSKERRCKLLGVP